MKLSLERLLVAGVRDPTVIGFLVQDNVCIFYTMKQDFEAKYPPVRIGDFKVPRGNDTLGLLITKGSLFLTTMSIVETTVRKIRSRTPLLPQSTMLLMIRKSYDYKLVVWLLPVWVDGRSTAYIVATIPRDLTTTSRGVFRSNLFTLE
ncbi:hypothetical protein B0O80DRAFT_185877 [Mortierella sp. GBAus27b]|nr:hypothetical protein B0O80DRAFT_185877 [Mortierella sp. GBAus27b]